MKKIIFIVFLILTFILNHFTRSYSLFVNYLIIGLLNVFLTYYLLKINPFKKVGLFLIFLSSILTICVLMYSLIYNEVIFILGIIAILLTTVLGYFFFKYQDNIFNKYIFTLYLLLFSTSIYYYENILNFYYDSFNQVIMNVEFPNIEIVDYNSNKIKLPDNKLIIIDLWSNYCANCITEFPKFENLSKEFKSNDKVYFFALNIFHRNPDVIKTKSFLKGYTFQNFYTNEDIFKILNFNSVPNYVVLNKNKKVIYFGSLNTKFKNSKSYIYDIIKKETN